MPVDPLLQQLRKKREHALAIGSERVARQHARGKMSARERIQYLLDKGSFHELEGFATQRGNDLGLSEEKIPGDGVVTGYGKLDGRIVYLYAQDFSVLGGSLGEMHAARICRVMDLALQSGSPIIGLLDSGGARIQEGVRALRGYAEIFRRNTQASGVIPQISVMLGPCAGGAAYSPALTDLIIMVENQSFMFLTGPEVIKAVTNEAIDHERLGGASVHTAVSGTAHLSAPDERSALNLVRLALSFLPSNHTGVPPTCPGAAPRKADTARLNNLVPIDPMDPYSMHAVITGIVDRGRFLELMPAWAKNAVTGLARVGGHSFGIVANEPEVIGGVMDIDSADKIARFVRFCDSFRLPILTLVDSPGFLPGVAQEYAGVIRHGAKVLYAYAEAIVPKISVVTRKAYGGAYIVMSSKFLGSDVNLAWHSAEIAVMGAEGAVNILYRDRLKAASDPNTLRRELIAEYQQKVCDPYTAASQGILDEVIEPVETRRKVIAALEALQDKPFTSRQNRHGNMPV